MPKRSNWFQRLISLLNQQLAQDRVSVTESKMLPDRSSEGEREVDIVLETVVAGHKVVVGIECRDRTRKADQGWVDQVHGTHQNLPVHQTILVSRSGFTKPALQKCRSLNIEAVTFDADHLPDWAGIVRKLSLGLLHVFFTPHAQSVRLVCDASEMPDGHAIPANPTLFGPSGGQIGSLQAVVQQAVNNEELVKQAEALTSPGSALTVRVGVPLEPGTYIMNEQGDRHVLRTIETEATCCSKNSILSLRRGVIWNMP